MMSFADLDTAPPRISLPSRVALALAHATVDSNAHPQVASFGSAGQEITQTAEDYVMAKFHARSKYTTLMGDTFPKTLANGTAALNGFRHYMVQDALYLDKYYRARMEAVSRKGSYEDIKEFVAKLSQSLQYVADAKFNLTYKLGILENEVKDEKSSKELDDSVAFYNGVASTGDWLDMHIAFLPCIMGYYDIASKLLLDPGTVRKFINGHIATLFTKLTPAQQTAKLDGWFKIFDEACTHETDFFRLGSSKNAYNIVSNGTYKIRSYLTGNPYLVANGSSVITQKDDPGSNGKWTLTNSPDGYTIKNGTKFLDSPTAPIHQGQEVSLSNKEKQYWSINPAEVQVGNPKLYQFLDPAGLQWVLDIDSASKVILGNNCQISSQSWLLEPAT